MSQPDFPKQFVSIFNNKPLINQTLNRLGNYFKKDERILIIPEQLKKITQRFIGNEHILIEPIRRNTAPAICLAAMVLKKEFGDGVLHIMPADHLITDRRNFIMALRFGEEIAKRGYLVTYGIKPTRPETGYGYINISGEIAGYKDLKAFEVRDFIEKPPLLSAKKYIKSKRYLWNSGIFTFWASDILKELEKYIPRVYYGVAKYLKTGKKSYFSKIPDVSIDYGVMEKSDRICIIRGNFLWDDVGSWLALERYFKKDDNQNIFIGDAMGLEMKDSIVYTYGMPVRVYGVKGLIIVVSPSGVLVCRKNRAPDLKKLLKI